MEKQVIPNHKIKVPKNPIKEMFSRQLAFEKKLGNTKTVAAGETFTPETLTHLKEMLLAINVETCEALDQIPGWKSWSRKPALLTKEARWEYLNELVDVMHFMINASLIVGCTADEFVYMFFNKQHENKERQKRGY